jgi:hypothetical protein
MLRLRAMGAVITVQMPYRNEDVPMAIVAVDINRHSWIVDLKHAGRPAGSEISDGVEVPGDSTAVEEASTIISGTPASGVKSTMAGCQVLGGRMRRGMMRTLD